VLLFARFFCCRSSIFYHFLLYLSAISVVWMSIKSSARFLIPSQAKPVAVKRHRKRVRLKTNRVANDNIGFSVQEAQANKAFACHAVGISDGSTIFAEWPENQQEAFFRAAGGAKTDRNQMLLAIATVSHTHNKYNFGELKQNS
jgi:hypothetical protein